MNEPVKKCLIFLKISNNQIHSHTSQSSKHLLRKNNMLVILIKNNCLNEALWNIY